MNILIPILYFLVVKDGQKELFSLEKWKVFMRQYFSSFQINKVILKHKEAEDRPVKLTTEMKLLVDAGFRDIDIIWKFYNFAVYGGSKGR